MRLALTLALKWLKANWIETLLVILLVGGTTYTWVVYGAQKRQLQSQSETMKLLADQLKTASEQLKAQTDLMQKQTVQLEDLALRQAALATAVSKTQVKVGAIDTKFDAKSKADAAKNNVPHTVPKDAPASDALTWANRRVGSSIKTWAQEGVK